MDHDNEHYRMDIRNTTQHNEVPLLKNSSGRKCSCSSKERCLLYKVLFIAILCVQVLFSAYFYKQVIFRISYLNGSVSIRSSRGETIANKTTSLGVEVLPLCPKTPPGLLGSLSVSFAKPSHSLKKIRKDNPLVEDGGYFKPELCSSRSKVAIIIPFRNRDVHLRYFLQYMHPVLQRQQLEYRIYIINQYGNGKFNRAKLINVGFVESKKDLDFGCFVFHDVDLILENDNAIYSCPEMPRHLSSAIDKFRYRLMYESMFGGVTELTKEQFELVNGYSNSFWGWGGEDDDMYNRIRFKRMKVMRYPITVSRYKMVFHKREKGNEVNPIRKQLTRLTKLTMNKDGLNSLKYDVIKRDNNQLYTNITVEIYPLND